MNHALRSRRSRLLCVLALIVLVGLAVAAAPPVSAAVSDVADNGFTVTVTTSVSASAEKLYAALLDPARWWSSEHTFSGKASNLHLDAKAGGCFCERLPGGGSVEHLRVVYLSPNKVLRLRGALGPFQGLGVDGALTWTIKSASATTSTLTLTYALGGYNKGGFNEWAKAADGMLSEQAGRLKAVMEGRPAGGR